MPQTHSSMFIRHAFLLTHFSFPTFSTTVHLNLPTDMISLDLTHTPSPSDNSLILFPTSLSYFSTSHLSFFVALLCSRNTSLLFPFFLSSQLTHVSPIPSFLCFSSATHGRSLDPLRPPFDQAHILRKLFFPLSQPRVDQKTRIPL